jgi:hypothetical protein
LLYTQLSDRPFPAVLGWGGGQNILVEYNTSATDSPSPFFPAPARRFWSGWNASQDEASTPAVESLRPTSGLREALLSLFEDVREERFEFGEEASFDTRLTRLLANEKRDVLGVLLEILMDSDIPSREAASRAVIVVARSDEVGSSKERLRFLGSVLGHPRASMRDSAVVGLFDLGTLDALPALRDALRGEQSSEIRKSLTEAISALEHRAS